MPKSKHRKNHKAKVKQRQQEHALKLHRTKAFAQKITEAVKAHQENELNQHLTSLTSLPSVEINLD